MTSLAALQVLASFIIGGIVVAALSLLAEKASEKVAGIIITFPTTIVISFFFLGFATSAKQVAAIVPATLMPIGIIMLLAVVYIQAAIWLTQKDWSKLKQIAVSLLISTLVWMVLVLPLAMLRLNNLVFGVVGYTFCALLAHYLLNRDKTVFSITKPAYDIRQVLFRAIFIGSIIAIIVFLGKTTGPFWGGIFTMFPAATFAGLMILHFYYEPSQLFFFMRRAPLGSVALFVYAISVMLLFPKLGVAGGTGVSYCISMLVSLAMVQVQKRRG